MSDLGGLGGKTGAPVIYTVGMGTVIRPFLPWLLVLALMFAGVNRFPRAWWIWVPLLGLLSLFGAIRSLFVFIPIATLDMFYQAFSALVFAVAATWLLMPHLGGRSKVARFFRTFGLVAIGTMSVGFGSGGLNDDPGSLIFPAVLAFVAALAFSMALVCRKNTSSFARFLLWFPAWMILLWLIATVPFLLPTILMGNALILGILVLVLSIAVCTFVVFLPFLLLSLADPFYRARFRRLLGHLPESEDQPPPLPMDVPPPLPVATNT
jgi:drug/metabolite transporter (DMT)-like permease